MVKYKFCPNKIIASKGQKRIVSVTSWEHGKNNTVTCAMSASGSFIPPLFIFLRKIMDMKLSKNGPLGAIYECTKNGWTTEVFLKWLKHFYHHSNPTGENPVLLILDNHGSHISLKAYEFCKEHNIVMLSLPPHTLLRMQPLDVTFFGQLKAAFRKECDIFIKNYAMVFDDSMIIN